MNLGLAIGEGILGGLILNVMPCVFPVLFFKLQGIIEHSEATVRERRRDSIAYLGGTLVTFGAFGAVVIALRASGDTLGWGMQMQNPTFVAFIVALLFIFGLNALGIFQLRFAITGGGPTQTGPGASFFDGALVTLVSTPCSAPFLGGAAGYALANDISWWQTLSVFGGIAFGLALPVLAIGFFPLLFRLLPRPGAWMEHFKILTGFTLLGAAVYYFGTLQKQISPNSARDYLFFLLGVALALYYLERNANSAASALKRNSIRAALVGAVVGAGVVFLGFEPPAAKRIGPTTITHASSIVDGEIKWTPYSETVRQKAMAIKRPVFVDYTADWCVSCKAFEATHINTDGIRSLLDQTGVLAAKADLTNEDDALWDELKRLGRNGLPVYVIYLPDGTHDLLPEGPPLDLADRLQATAKRYPPTAFTN